MAIIITQTPMDNGNRFDMAYGPNPVTVSGLPTDPNTGAFTASKYVLQIWRGVGGTGGTYDELIADIRQSPNSSAVAIFDIQNVLQNFVAPSINSIEETGLYGNNINSSANETVSYQIRASYETANGTVPPYPGDQWAVASNLIDLGGTKEYYQIPFFTADYIPAISAISGCTNVTKKGKPFTDRQKFILGSQITDGKPAWLDSGYRVYEMEVTASDMTTVSYWNEQTNISAPIEAASIEAFVFWLYNGNTYLGTEVIYNVTGEGGGPNDNPGDGTKPQWPLKAVTVGSGPKNSPVPPVGITHYYLTTSAYTSAGCPVTNPGLTDISIHDVIRFNIVDESCNDFPEYQFSWLNSYGFRDYYSFRKRKDRSVNIQRNEYLKEAADYDSTSYDVNIYDRGTTVYSQKLQEEFTAFTGFISDEDAKFLQGLFISADVKVRFADSDNPTQWVPVALTSTTYVEKTNRKDKLFQYDIRFKRAHNLKSQRG